MADVPYFELLKKSFRQFFANLVLLLPILVSLGFMIVFLFVLGIELGILLIVNQSSILAVLAQPELIGGLFSAKNIILLVLFFMLDIVILIIIGAYATGMKIGMYKEVIDGGKAYGKNMFSYGRRYFGVVLGVTVIRTLLVLVPMFILGGIAALALAVSKVVGALLIVIFILAFIAYAIFLSFAFFFADPIIVSRKGTARDMVKASFGYMRQNFRQVFATWGITLLVFIAVSIVLSPLDYIVNPATPATEAVAITSAIIAGSIILGVIRAIVNIVVGFGTDLFRFNSYFYVMKKK